MASVRRTVGIAEAREAGVGGAPGCGASDE